MKVSAQELEPRQMVLEVEVEEERVERALDQAYKRIANRINVPGFRRGRAPRPLVERMVGRQALLEDAVEHLVPEVYKDALADQQIEAAGQPSLEVTSTEPLHFKATVPLEPKIELGDYRSIEEKLEPATVEEREIDEVVESLRNSYATWTPVERPVRVGDRVGIDVKATRGDRTITDSQDAEFVVNPDGPEPATGFSEQLVGLEAGQQKSFDLAGEADGDEPPPEPTHFEVALKWVKEKELPELDDEFARTVGEQETVEALRAEIAEQIRRRKEAQAQEKQRDAVVSAAVDQSTVEIPPQLVERQARQLLESMAATLDRQGISIEQYLQFTGKDEATFRSELMVEAETTLKRSLVLEAIARHEGLTVDEAEVRQEIELAARGSKNPAQTARQAFNRPETRSRIESVLLTRKAVDHLVEMADGVPSETAASTTSETVASSASTESTGESTDE